MDIQEKIEILSRYSALHLFASNATYERNKDNLHLYLSAQDKIESEVKRGTPIIIITGEAGEGKSHIINYLKNNVIEVSDYHIFEDFSALAEADKTNLVKGISDFNLSKKKYLIGANIGILVRKIMQTNFELLKSISASSIENASFFVINLEKRNLAQDPDRFQDLVKKFYRVEENVQCKDYLCSLRGKCPFLENLSQLTKAVTIENIRILCDAIFLMGGHITLRELFSFLSTLATAGYNCESAKALGVNARQEISFHNVFDKRDGVVLDKIACLDPAKQTAKDDYLQFINSKNQLKDYIAEKRRSFFATKFERPYEKLPVAYLQDYKELLDKIKQAPYYYDITEEAQPCFIYLKEGFVRLLSPDQTNLQISSFDIPRPVKERIKTQFPINFDELSMLWHHPHWTIECAQKALPATLSNEINHFCLSVLKDEKEGEFDNGGLVTLTIGLELYQQICRARDYYFMPRANTSLSKYGLQEFFMKILRLNSEYSSRVNILFDPPGRYQDFEMSFYQRNKRLQKNVIKKVVIKKA